MPDWTGMTFSTEESESQAAVAAPFSLLVVLVGLTLTPHLHTTIIPLTASTHPSILRNIKIEEELSQGIAFVVVFFFFRI